MLFKDFSELIYNARVHLLLILVQVVFSGWQIIGSVALKDGANPLVVALYRQSLASILMLSLLLYFNKDAIVPIKYGDIPRFVFVGFCSFLNVVGTLFALEYLSPTTYAVMQPIVPVLATIISFISGYESLNLLKCLGIVAAVAGAVIVQMFTDSDDNSNDSKETKERFTIGMILVLFQCLGDANSVVFQRKLVQHYYALYVTAIYYAVGAIVTGVLSLGFYSKFTPSSLYFDGSMLPWFAVAYCVLLTSMFCYGAISWSVKRVSPSITTIYYTLQPVATVLFMYALFTKVPTMAETFGGLLVALGLIVTVYGRQVEAELEEQQADLKYRESLLSSVVDNNSHNDEGDNISGSGSAHTGSSNSTVLSSVLSRDEHHALLHSYASGGVTRSTLSARNGIDWCVSAESSYSYCPVSTPSPLLPATSTGTSIGSTSSDS